VGIIIIVIGYKIQVY